MDHIGRPATFHALGQEWTLARWTRSVWHDLIEYAKTILPDPRMEAEEILRYVPESDSATRVQVVRDAILQSRSMFTIGSKQIQEFIATTDGVTYLLYLLLRPNHPEITLDQVFEIASHPPPEMAKALERAAGVVSPNDGSPGS